MAAYCDLHNHSIFSDGTDTPAQLLEKAQAQGLCAIALTDHNTVEGLPSFMEAAKKSPVRAIPGVEFSADYQGMELHILCLFLEPTHYQTVTDVVEDYHHRKEQSNIELVGRLSAAGYILDYEKIKAATPSGQVNRALIAAELTQLGYTQSIQEAFQQLLGHKCGYYVPPRRPSPFEVISLIKSLGAVAVLAHPFLSMNEEQLREFLPQAVKCGLDGMETIYSTYDKKTQILAETMADEFGLLHSGGSDYHGKNKPHIEMGVGQGDLAVPERLLTALEAQTRNL